MVLNFRHPGCQKMAFHVKHQSHLPGGSTWNISKRDACGLILYSTGDQMALKEVFLVYSGISTPSVWSMKNKRPRRVAGKKEGGMAFLVHLSFVVPYYFAIYMPPVCDFLRVSITPLSFNGLEDRTSSF
jgi:hypothetical protein